MNTSCSRYTTMQYVNPQQGVKEENNPWVLRLRSVECAIIASSTSLTALPSGQPPAPTVAEVAPGFCPPLRPHRGPAITVMERRLTIVWERGVLNSQCTGQQHVCVYPFIYQSA